MSNALRLVHKNTPPNQNIRFKANVIKISRYIFGYLTAMITNCLPLVHDCVAIIMFDKTKRKGTMYDLDQRRKQIFIVI